MKQCLYRFVKNKKQGFTLIELIVVLSILLILGFIITPTVTGIIGQSKEELCVSNRKTILRYYASYHLLDPNSTLEGVMADECAGMTCPAGGTYTIVQDPDTGEYDIVCSIHGSLSGGEPSGGSENPGGGSENPGGGSENPGGGSENPGGGTTDPNIIYSTGVSVNSTWPEDSEFWSNGYAQTVCIYYGETFLYNGKYYIVYNNPHVDLYNGSETPTPTNGWWKDWGVAEITGRVIEWNGGDSASFKVQYKNDMPQRGDIVKVNGEYYIFTLNNQSDIDPPNVNMANWVKLS